MHLASALRIQRREAIRFSKKAQMHKIVIGLAMNIWFFGYHYLIQ